MGFIDLSSPTKWGIFKIAVVVLCLLIVVGVFLPWSWFETKTKVSGVVETTVRKEAVGTDWTDSWLIFFAALFSLFFVFLNYNINLNIENRPRRINELLSGMFAFLIFADSAVCANKINKDIGEATVSTGYANVSGGIGAGLWIIVISSFLLMIFSFLLWKQRTQGAVAQVPVTVAPVQTPAHPVSVPPAPVSKEKAIVAFAKIPGITIKKAISLYDAGFKSFSDLKAAPSDRLLAVKGITLTDVKNIKKELEF